MSEREKLIEIATAVAGDWWEHPPEVLAAHVVDAVLAALLTDPVLAALLTDPVRAVAKELWYAGGWLRAVAIRPVETPIHRIDEAVARWDRAVQKAHAALAADREPEPVRATDPVRAAAKAFIEAEDRWRHRHDCKISDDIDVKAIDKTLACLRAALTADREPEPVQVTDEMVERGVRAAWAAMAARRPTYSFGSFAQLTGDIQESWRLDVRAALSAALSEPPPEGESDG